MTELIIYYDTTGSSSPVHERARQMYYDGATFCAEAIAVIKGSIISLAEPIANSEGYRCAVPPTN